MSQPPASRPSHPVPRIPHPVSRIIPPAIAILTGALLAVSFAPLEMADAAWCALVPLLIACFYAEPVRAARLGWVAGMVFWLTSIWWLTRVTSLGWLLLCAYTSLYLMPAAFFSSWWFRRFGVGRFLPNAGFMILVTGVWVSFEYLRMTLFTGFPWHPLGASQYANLTFLQHASWGGVYPLSALLVWANAAIAVTVLRYLDKQTRLGRKPHPELMIGMTLIVVAFMTGAQLLRASDDTGGRELRLALVQPAIPQEQKWTPETAALIYERLENLTSSAVTWTRPEMVVWPETAVPDDLLYSEESFRLVDRLARLGSPLLIGSMDAEYLAGRHPKFYNSVFLIDTNAMVTARYDKRHLVLFGEYIPLHQHIRFITAMTPIQESFSPGSTSTVFRVPSRGIPFASLICFEDTLAYLGRASVRNGARLLVNQTNDAWFDPSAASRQHMVLCVFRAVENRVPVVRAANSGYTCAIDARGRIRETLLGEGGAHDGPGFLSATVSVPPDHMPLTFYTRHGDVFAWSCLPFGLVAIVAAWRGRRDV